MGHPPNDFVMKLSIALLLAAGTASAQRLVPEAGFARLPGPTLKLADSARIDMKKYRIEPPLTLFAGPKGGIVVYSQWRSVTAFDSLARRRWSQGSDNNDKREVADVTAFGWNAGGMWVSDAAWEQVALLDDYGNVTRSLELPSWVRPTFSNRKSFPVFESMRVYAVYPNGDMLVIPRGSMSITGATGYDQNATYYLRINEDGIIQKSIAKFPSNIVRGKEGNREFSFQNPLYQWVARATPDGARIMVVNVDTAAAKTDTVVVRALGEKGETLFTQKFAYPALVYTQTQVDSIARARWGNDTDYREARAKLLPRRQPTVVDMAVDPETRSTWISLRGDANSRSVIGIDAAGRFIGKLLLPRRASVKAVSANGLWVGEARNDLRGDIVRYRVAPAK
jgi:hypothetical protein